MAERVGITIEDAATGTTAAVLPEAGFNCFSFRPVVGGRVIDALWSEPDFGPHSRPTRNGIPLLFPWVGRLESQDLTYKGQRYHLVSARVEAGRAIHGFVVDRPWRVVEQESDRIVGEFHAGTDAPELLDQWPSDFSIQVEYQVAGSALHQTIRVSNPSREGNDLPFVLGAHPYFRVPLAGDDPAACLVTVPASELWELAELVPTGQRRPVQPDEDLRSATPFPDIALDAVLSGLDRTDDGHVQTMIEDRAGGVRLVQTAEPVFDQCVVFVPPHREAIAIEPYTGPPNAFALDAAGVATGLRTVPPGKTFTARVRIEIKPITT